jgi:TonB family protein
MRKLKIMPAKPEISDEELLRYMNFEKLLALKKSNDARKTAAGRTMKIMLWIGALGIIGFTGYLLLDSDPASTPAVESSVTAIPDSAHSLHQAIEPGPEEKASGQAHQEVIEIEKINEQATKITEPEAQPADERAKDSATQGTFNYVEAEPLEGYPHLYDYFASELKYPEVAMKDSISGIVSISFVLNNKGKPEQIKVLNSLGEAFDQEALRIIENMPAWKPATLNGNPVPSKISVPLSFQFKKELIKP